MGEKRREGEGKENGGELICMGMGHGDGMERPFNPIGGINQHAGQTARTCSCIVHWDNNGGGKNRNRNTEV